MRLRRYEKENPLPYFELNDLERAFHDKEWGTPCRNDRRLFEYLMYEVLQCGLSWDTIIQKRAAFRVAFERFDFEKIARYGERDIARILAVPARLGRNKWYNTDIGNKRRMNTMELDGPKEDLLSI